MDTLIVWVDKRLALAIHERQLAEHGGSSGVRDEKLLESALACPQQSHACGNAASDLADLAASLAFGLARNHPFVDGNKRTAHVCYRVLLALNDVEFEATAGDKYAAMMGLATGSTAETDFAAWLRPRLKFVGRARVHEKRARYARR